MARNITLFAAMFGAVIRQSIVQTVRVQKSLVRIQAEGILRPERRSGGICFAWWENHLSYSIDTNLRPAYPFRLFLAGVFLPRPYCRKQVHETHIPAQ